MRSDSKNFSVRFRRVVTVATSFILLGSASVMMAAEATAAPARAAGQSTVQCKEHYTVKPGDTLIKIGDKFHVDWHEIAKVNNVENPNFIEANEPICIPE